MKKLFTSVALGLLILGSLSSCKKTKEDYKKEYVEMAKESIELMTNKDLSDEEKEEKMKALIEEQEAFEKEVEEAGFSFRDIRKESKKAIRELEKEILK